MHRRVALQAAGPLPILHPTLSIPQWSDACRGDHATRERVGRHGALVSGRDSASTDSSASTFFAPSHSARCHPARRYLPIGTNGVTQQVDLLGQAMANWPKAKAPGGTRSNYVFLDAAVDANDVCLGEAPICPMLQLPLHCPASLQTTKLAAAATSEQITHPPTYAGPLGDRRRSGE